MILFIFWIIFAIIVAAFADDRKMGFWGGLFLSLVLSPIIGAIIVALSEKKDLKKEKSMELFSLATKAIKKKDYRAEKQCYQRIIDNDPENAARACFKMALAYARNDDMEGVIFWLKNALKRGFTDLDALRYNPALEKVRSTEAYKNIMNEFVF